MLESGEDNWSAMLLEKASCDTSPFLLEEKISTKQISGRTLRFVLSFPVGRGETSVSFDDKLPRFYDIFARSLLDSFQYGRSSK